MVRVRQIVIDEAKFVEAVNVGEIEGKMILSAESDYVTKKKWDYVASTPKEVQQGMRHNAEPHC
jgi:hypothetical protein